jgi:hypothetical protein
MVSLPPQDYLQQLARIIAQKFIEEKPCASDLIKARELGLTIEQLDIVIKSAVAMVKLGASEDDRLLIPHLPSTEGAGAPPACKATLTLDGHTWTCLREKGHVDCHNVLLTKWWDRDGYSMYCAARAHAHGVKLLCDGSLDHEGSHTGHDALKPADSKEYVWASTPPPPVEFSGDAPAPK